MEKNSKNETQYARPPMEIETQATQRTREHRSDEKENLQLLISRREEFLDKNIESVQVKRDENSSTIANLEKAIEGNNLVIENLRRQKMEALEGAMESRERALAISKPRAFEKFTRFFVDRFNPGRVIIAKVLNPFKAMIDACDAKEGAASDKTEEELQKDFSNLVKDTIDKSQESYKTPVGKIQAFINITEEAIKKAKAIGVKEDDLEENSDTPKGFDEEIII